MPSMTYRMFRTIRWGWLPEFGRLWRRAKRNQVNKRGSRHNGDYIDSSNNVITIDDKRIKSHLDRIVRGSVEEALNALLEAETNRAVQCPRATSGARRERTPVAGIMSAGCRPSAGEVRSKSAEASGADV